MWKLQRSRAHQLGGGPVLKMKLHHLGCATFITLPPGIIESIQLQKDAVPQGTQDSQQNPDYKHWFACPKETRKPATCYGHFSLYSRPF